MLWGNGLNILRDMKGHAWCWSLLAGLLLAGNVRAETGAESDETPLSFAANVDLKALAKKAPPAVLLLVVSDATGKRWGIPE